MGTPRFAPVLPTSGSAASPPPKMGCNPPTLQGREHPITHRACVYRTALLPPNLCSYFPQREGILHKHFRFPLLGGKGIICWWALQELGGVGEAGLLSGFGIIAQGNKDTSGLFFFLFSFFSQQIIYGKEENSLTSLITSVFIKD